MKIGIVGNVGKRVLPDVLQQVLEGLVSRRIPYVVDARLRSVLSRKFIRSYTTSGSFGPQKALRTCNIVISLGGDGTMLETARLLDGTEIPILGVNLGKLGFLAEVQMNEIDQCLDEILNGRYTVEPRMRLQALGKGLGSGYTALNDIVLDLTQSSRVMHVETWVDGQYLATFTGDGIIVSTPTGSTGYALSNGGPILPPQTKAIMISPICPHTLTARPVVLPETSKVTLKVSDAPARLQLTADGQPSALLKVPASVEVKRSEHGTFLVKREGSRYFDVLRGKLQWGKDVRTDPS